MTVFQGIFNGICIVIALAVMWLIFTNRLKDEPISLFVAGPVSIVFRLICLGIAIRYRSDCDLNFARMVPWDSWSTIETVELTSSLLFISMVLQISAIVALLIQFRPADCGNCVTLLMFTGLVAFGVFLFAFPVWLAGIAATPEFSEMAQPRWIIAVVWAILLVRVSGLVGAAAALARGNGDVMCGCGIFVAIACCAGGGANYFYVCKQYELRGVQPSYDGRPDAQQTFNAVLAGFGWSEILMIVCVLLPIVVKCCISSTADCASGMADGLREAATDWADGNYDIVTRDENGREISRRQGGLPGLFK
jgi:hypothetical protein